MCLCLSVCGVVAYAGMKGHGRIQQTRTGGVAYIARAESQRSRRTAHGATDDRLSRVARLVRGRRISAVTRGY